MAYSNINLTEGIGYTVNVLIKGVAQLATGTIDSALSSSNDLVGLLAVGFVVGAVVFLVGMFGNLKREAGRLF